MCEYVYNMVAIYVNIVTFFLKWLSSRSCEPVCANVQGHEPYREPRHGMAEQHAGVHRTPEEHVSILPASAGREN